MKKAVHWVASIAAAGLIVFVLDKLLPPDITHVWLMAIGGLSGILWFIFVDRPLKALAQNS